MSLILDGLKKAKRMAEARKRRESQPRRPQKRVNWKRVLVISAAGGLTLAALDPELLLAILVPIAILVTLGSFIYLYRGIRKDNISRHQAMERILGTALTQNPRKTAEDDAEVVEAVVISSEPVPPRPKRGSMDRLRVFLRSLRDFFSRNPETIRAKTEARDARAHRFASMWYPLLKTMLADVYSWMQADWEKRFFRPTRWLKSIWQQITAMTARVRIWFAAIPGKLKADWDKRRIFRWTHISTAFVWLKQQTGTISAYFQKRKQARIIAGKQPLITAMKTRIRTRFAAMSRWLKADWRKRKVFRTAWIGSAFSWTKQLARKIYAYFHLRRQARIFSGRKTRLGRLYTWLKQRPGKIYAYFRKKLKQRRERKAQQKEQEQEDPVARPFPKYTVLLALVIMFCGVAMSSNWIMYTGLWVALTSPIFSLFRLSGCRRFNQIATLATLIIVAFQRLQPVVENFMR